jgi:hypothetical protein
MMNDPYGFCLAWCYLYLDIKLLISKTKYKNINPIDYINWYIIHKFKIDYPNILNDKQNNIYMNFIRFYGKRLDTLKNNLLKKLNIDYNLLYHNNLTDVNNNNICISINKELYEILSIK